MSPESAIHSLSATETEQMLALYLTHVQQQLNASGSIWIAAYRGKFGRDTWRTRLMDDWKILDSRTSGATAPVTLESEQAYFANAEESGLDPQARHAIHHAGRTRVHRLADVVAANEWESHWMSERLRGENVGERLVGAFSLGPDAESYVLVDRAPGQPGFSTKDADVLLDLIRRFPRLHYWLMLERGLVSPATRSFSPRQREVVHCLLGPHTENRIAAQLDLSKGALHNYVTDIYKNLDVSSRHELVQCWLQGVPESEPPC